MLNIDSKKLRLAMTRACMRPSAVSKESGVPTQTINRALCGRNVRIDTLGKICKALGIDPAEIIKED